MNAQPSASDAFRHWFGESKAVDANGQPLVVYHGTGDDFDTFVFSVYVGIQGGMFFSVDAAVAGEFALSAQEATGNEGRVLEVHLSIRNPKHIAAADIMDDGIHSFAREFAAVAQARGEGHDGLFIRAVPEHDGRVADQWVAFSPDQIYITGVTLVDDMELVGRACAVKA